MKKKACVLIGCLSTCDSSSRADNQTTNQFVVLSALSALLFTHLSLHQCLFQFPVFSPPICPVSRPQRNLNLALLLISPGQLFPPPQSGRVYRPFLVQLNVSLSDSRPCLAGAPGSSVHGQLMANPKSECGQLFPPKAAQMPPAPINTWNTGNVSDTQLSGKTWAPEKLVIFGGLRSQWERIRK